MRILALPALYLVYKGLTSGEGVTLLSTDPEETPEEKAKREEQRREDKVAIEKQREKDEAEKVEEKKKAESEAQKIWQTIEDKILRGEGRLTCKYGFKEKIIIGTGYIGIMSKHSYWICEKKPGIGF